MAEGGEVFHLDMGHPMRIHDLAVRMISLAGLRPRARTSRSARSACAPERNSRRSCGPPTRPSRRRATRRSAARPRPPATPGTLARLLDELVRRPRERATTPRDAARRSPASSRSTRRRTRRSARSSARDVTGARRLTATASERTGLKNAPVLAGLVFGGRIADAERRPVGRRSRFAAFCLVGERGIPRQRRRRPRRRTARIPSAASRPVAAGTLAPRAGARARGGARARRRSSLAAALRRRARGLPRTPTRAPTLAYTFVAAPRPGARLRSRRVRLRPARGGGRGAPRACRPRPGCSR